MTLSATSERLRGITQDVCRGNGRAPPSRNEHTTHSASPSFKMEPTAHARRQAPHSCLQDHRSPRPAFGPAAQDSAPCRRRQTLLSPPRRRPAAAKPGTLPCCPADSRLSGLGRDGRRSLGSTDSDSAYHGPGLLGQAACAADSR